MTLGAAVTTGQDDVDTLPAGTLRLAMYRLEQIEKNTQQLVSQETHQHLSGRVQALETEREQDRKNKRQLTIGVMVALIAPGVTAIPAVLQAIGQG